MYGFWNDMLDFMVEAKLDDALAHNWIKHEPFNRPAQ